MMVCRAAFVRLRGAATTTRGTGLRLAHVLRRPTTHATRGTIFSVDVDIGPHSTVDSTLRFPGERVAE